MLGRSRPEKRACPEPDPHDHGSDSGSQTSSSLKRFCPGLSQQLNNMEIAEVQVFQQHTEQMEVAAAQQTHYKVVSGLVPAVPRRCIRCMAGEPGHINHILS